METVRGLLKRKGAAVWTVAPEATVFEALELMAGRDVGALVVATDGKPVGIFSERDYARKVILKGRSSRDLHVRDIMSAPVITVGPDQSVEDCMQTMTERRLRHLPVVEAGALVGLVSIGDVVKSIMETQKSFIGQLESYVRGQ